MKISIKSIIKRTGHHPVISSFIFLFFCTAACQAPLNEIADLDRDIGKGKVSGAAIITKGGLAAIREMAEGRITFWLQAPAQTIDIDLSGSVISDWTFTLLNAMPGTILQNPGSVISYTETQDRTTYSIDLELSPGSAYSLAFAPDDFDSEDQFSFAAMADVQGEINKVGDIYSKMNADPSLRFVVFPGDLTENLDREYKSEYTKFIGKMALLNIPIYSTPGNHDMGDNGPEYWHELFGRANVHFHFKGAAFTLVDSSRATVEPDVYGWIENWCDEDKHETHFFFTHYPLLDPVGIRAGSFRSKNEAYKLIAILLEGRVDAAFHGHVHSYYSYHYSSMPAYISGGGGALPEKFDGVGRHYLKVTADAVTGLQSVKVVEVD